MTKPAYDPVKVAKSLAKTLNLPLANVSQIMQKYPIGPQSSKKIIADLEKLHAQLLMKALKENGLL